MDTKTIFSEKPKELRRKKGYTQRQLADKLEISFQAISTYEQGKSVPQSDVLAQIAQKLEVSADYLLGLTEEETTDPEIRAIAKYLGMEVDTVQLVLDYNKLYDGMKYSKTYVIEKMLKDRSFRILIDRCCAALNTLQAGYDLSMDEVDLCYQEAVSNALKVIQENFFDKHSVDASLENKKQNDMLIYQKSKKLF